MELLIIIGVIWLLVSLFGSSSKKGDTSNETRRHAPPSPPPIRPRQTQARKPNPDTFRPKDRASNSPNIRFGKTSSETSSSSSGTPIETELKGLHDAFTGAPLDKSLGLHQCQACKVYYHTESLRVLKEANSAQCVACQSTNIISIVLGGKATGGKDYQPNVVTLQNYQRHVGRVVTFEGRVHKVNESKRGGDFAVMFEDKSWTKGFKLVFFDGSVRKVGGERYIKSFTGRKVKVRGLVIKHPTFGYEIIVSEKSMILSVD